MYSFEDRIRAVKFYINCSYDAAYTVSKLGYPDAILYSQISEKGDTCIKAPQIGVYSAS